MTTGPPAPRDPSSGGSEADRLWWYRDVRLPVPVVSSAHRRETRRRHLLDALTCLTLSTLCFSQARSELLFMADWDFYNQVPLKAATVLAFLLNVIGLAAGGYLALLALRRIPGPAGRRLAAGAAAAALLVALNFARITYEVVGRWTEPIGGPGLLGLAGLLLAVSLGWPRPALRAMRALALVVSPLAVITLAHALWMFLELAAGPEFRPIEPAPLKASAPSLRRVVWVVFEGLDQGLAFEARPAGLELPELDRFRRESLYADAARPPAGVTEISLPALITGRPVIAVVPTSPNELELTFADGKVGQWSIHPNVFSRARALGYDTAVIGWQLPYPRVLGRMLGAADWRPSVAHEQARGETFRQALRNQWGSLAPPAHARRILVQRFAELSDLAFRAAVDARFGLVLLHLPLPQPPGIYDPATGRLTTWSFSGPAQGSLDNLALADRVLGDLRRSLGRAGHGDRTWIVVSSAHGGRASHNHRVPFLVRPPSGGRARHVDVPFNTLATRDLLVGILRGSISDTEDAATWLARQPTPAPRTYTSEGRPIY